MDETEKGFYEEVRSAIEHFAKSTIDDIKGSEEIKHSEIKTELEMFRKLSLSNEALENLRKIIIDSSIGAVHSIFVSIDGGTALSNQGKALELINRKTGDPLTRGALHENFMEVFD